MPPTLHYTESFVPPTLHYTESFVPPTLHYTESSVPLIIHYTERFVPPTLHYIERSMPPTLHHAESSVPPSLHYTDETLSVANPHPPPKPDRTVCAYNLRGVLRAVGLPQMFSVHAKVVLNVQAKLVRISKFMHTSLVFLLPP